MVMKCRDPTEFTLLIEGQQGSGRDYRFVGDIVRTQNAYLESKRGSIEFLD